MSRRAPVEAPGPAALQLVGRDAERAALASDYRAAAAGAGRLVLVTGAAGIGKTSLCQVVVPEWTAAGALVLPGFCLPAGGAEIAYAPFLTAWSAATPASGRRPDFGQLLTGLARLGEVPVEVGRAWLTEQVLGQVRAWSRRRPVVLLVEDTQWMDASSLAVLEAVARFAPGHRLLILATARQDAPPRPAAGPAAGAPSPEPAGPPLRLVELAAGPHGRQLRLGPLPAPAVRELARAAGGPDVDTDSVVRRSQGHPLFAYELARHGGDRLPPTLRTLLAGQIAGLGPGGPELIAAVALAGGDGGERICAGLAGPVTLAAALRRGLLDTDGVAIRLRHDLVGEVALAGLLPEQRRRLCARVATALAGPPPATTPAATLARLWEEAGRPEPARLAWVAAGRQATGRRGYAEAARAYQRALALGGGPEVALAAADALRWAGDPDRAEAVLRSTLDSLAGGQDRQRCLLLDAWRAIAHAARRTAEAGDLVAALRAAAAGVPDLDIQARVAVAEANQSLHRGLYAEGAAAAERAGRLADAASLPAIAATARNLAASCRAMLGEVAEGLAQLAVARRQAERAGDVPQQTRIAANHAFVLGNATRYEECARVCQAGLDRLAGHGLTALGDVLRYNLVVALIALGRWEPARRECDPPPGSGPHWHASLLLRHAEIAALRGEDGLAGELIDRAEARAAAGIGPEVEYARAVRLRARGRHREAVAASRAGLSRSGATALACRRLALAVTGLGALADLHRSGGRARRLDQPELVAAELCEAAAAAARCWPAPAAPPEAALLLATCHAEAARLPARGCVPSSRSVPAGRDGPDPAEWAELADRWQALAMPYPAAYARVRQAEALLAGHRPAAGAPVLRTAHAAAAALGAAPLRAEAERIARRGRVPLLDATTGGPALSLLTRREREVLELVCWGRTNREIAGELWLSERTVGVHVSRVLTKLGAGNRGEAARIAYQAGIRPAGLSTEET